MANTTTGDINTFPTTSIDTYFSNTSRENSSSVEETPLGMVSYLGMIIFGNVGFIGNTLVIIVIFSSTNMYTKVTNMLIINQSFLDLVGSILLLVFATMAEFNVTTKNFSGAGAQLFCSLLENQAILWAIFISSTINLVFLAVERYAAIIHPIRHNMTFTPVKAIVGCALTWVVGMTHQLAVAVPAASVVDGGCIRKNLWHTRATRVAMGVYLFLIQYVIPIAIMAYCYTKIVVAMRARIETQMKESKSMAKAKRSTLRTLVIVTVCYLLCWSGNQFLYFFFNLGLAPVSVLYGPFGNFTTIMVNLNCCVNPVVYASSYVQFRQGLQRLFCKKCGFSGNNGGGDDDTVGVSRMRGPTVA